MNAFVMAEPHKISAGALALLVHGIFFILLYFSFSWQMKPPQGMVVDIWDSLPADFEEQAQPQLEKQEPVIAAKVDSVPVAPSAADIELKNKKKLKAEKLNADNSASRKLAEKRAEQAERRMEEVERQAQSRSQAQNKAQKEAAAASGKVVDEYIAKIAAKIKRSIVLPPGVSKNIKAEFNVTLLPSGEVLNANLAKSSGNDAYDSAVERAILKAQPLPLPPAEQNMFNRFRDLHLKFSPAESGQ
jgi:colicin import membrane protein